MGPPQAVQKVRDNYYLVQVLVSESPSADWRRLFYETQQDVTPDFPTRSVEITGSLLRFRSDPATVQEKVGRIDRWLERANRKTRPWPIALKSSGGIVKIWPAKLRK